MISKRYFVFFIAFVLGCFLFKACHAEGLAHFSLERHELNIHASVNYDDHDWSIKNRTCKLTPMLVPIPKLALVQITHPDIYSLPITSHALFLSPLVLRL